ncbi:MAG: hydroxyacid dehydrogenase [Clostridia bacterium]
MAYTILIPEKVADEGLEYLRNKGYKIKMGRGLDKETLIEDLQDCDGVIIRVAVIDEEVFTSCPRLKVVSKHGVGVDSIDLNAAGKYGRRVVNVPNANTLSVGEQTMALIISCAKRLPFMCAQYKSGNYNIKDTILTNEISGKTLGLVGFGRIGATVAKMAKYGFSMNTIAYDPYIPKDKKFNEAVLVDSWEQLFCESDFVSVHMPATKETEKIIGEREFKLMKKSAFIINAARGKIIDEEALIHALKHNEIMGAGLDVSNPEPAHMSNPLFQMDNVIMTPHNAACTQEAMVRMAVGAAMGLDEVLSGKEPTYPVV